MFNVKHGHHAASSREPGYVEVYRRSIETRARAMPSPGWDSVRNECRRDAGLRNRCWCWCWVAAAPDVAVAVDVAGRTDRLRRIVAR